MANRAVALGVLAAVTLASCRSPDWRAVEVFYSRPDTTGIQDYVRLQDGTVLTVEFSDRSDAFKLAALRALGQCSSGGNDVIYGTYPPDSQQLIHVRGMLGKHEKYSREAQETFHEFVLKDWFIEVPVTVPEAEQAFGASSEEFKKKVVRTAAEANCKSFTFRGTSGSMAPFFRQRW